MGEKDQCDVSTTQCGAGFCPAGHISNLSLFSLVNAESLSASISDPIRVVKPDKTGPGRKSCRCSDIFGWMKRLATRKRYQRLEREASTATQVLEDLHQVATTGCQPVSTNCEYERSAHPSNPTDNTDFQRTSSEHQRRQRGSLRI